MIPDHQDEGYTLHEGYDTCENCYSSMTEGSGELVEIKDYWGRDVKMNVCKHCAAPVEIHITLLLGSQTYYIYFCCGLGQYHRVIEATGSTKEEALQNFRGKYVETFDRDLIRFKLIEE
jgi:hypothetical protein